MANTVEVVGGLGSATDSDVLVGVTYTSDNGIKRSGTFSPVAENVSYDGTSSGLSGASVQAAIDELNANLNNTIDSIPSIDGLVSSGYVDSQDAATIDAAKSYTDDKIALLLNNSSEAVDSIMELAVAMQENESVVDALEQAIGSKADVNHDHNDMYYTESEVDDLLSIKSDVTHDHDSAYDTKGSASKVLEDAKSYTNNAVAQKSQVQIITWGADD